MFVFHIPLQIELILQLPPWPTSFPVGQLCPKFLGLGLEQVLYLSMSEEQDATQLDSSIAHADHRPWTMGSDLE